MTNKDIQCEACTEDATALSGTQIKEQLQKLPAWFLVEENQIEKLRKEFTFSDFVSALVFTNKVGELAEKYNHHPDLLTQWGKVTVTWWSHKIKGIHQWDVDLAKKTDDLFC